MKEEKLKLPKEKKESKLKLPKIFKEKKQKPEKEAGALKSKKGKGKAKLPKFRMPKFINKIFFNSVGKRIMIIFLIVIVAMLALVLVLLSKSVSINKQYGDLLTNINKINTIKYDMVEQPARLSANCIRQISIEESGEEQIILQYKADLEDIGESISDDAKYDRNRKSLESMKKAVDLYLDYFQQMKEVCGENYNTKGNVAIYSMTDGGEYIAEHANKLIEYEVIRGQDIQAEIDATFSGLVRTIIISVSVIVIFSLILLIFLTRSVVKPVKELKKKLAVIADGDLTGEDVIVDTEDEMKQLALSFNNMSGSLKEIITSVYNANDEIDAAMQVVNEKLEENAKYSEKVSVTANKMTAEMKQQREETDYAMKQVEDMNAISGRIMDNADRINEKSENSLENARNGNENMIEYVSQLQQVNVVMQETSEVATALNTSV